MKIFEVFVEISKSNIKQGIGDLPKNVDQIIKDLLPKVRILVVDETLTRIEKEVIKKDHPEFPRILKMLQAGARSETAKKSQQRKIDEDGGIDKSTFGIMTSETIDLPFSTVFIETNDLSSPIQDNCCPCGDPQQFLYQNRTGILVHEIAPEDYMVCSLVVPSIHNQSDRSLAEPTMETLRFFSERHFTIQPHIEIARLNAETIKQSNICRILYAKLKTIFDKIRTKPVEYGSENVNIRFRTGHGENRQSGKIKSVIHVRLKSGKGNYTSGTSNIEWSHRWEVRGHWRKTQGVGKDREGAYNTQGFTWVIPHEKGPEEKDLVKKIRVVAA